MKNSIISSLIIFSVYLPAVAESQSHWTSAHFTVLDQPANQMMEDYLRNIIDRQFASRDSLLGSLKTAEQWGCRAQTIRDSIISWTGPLPERTPLNARITHTMERKGYTIEKLLFESRPGFLVSANLYLPKNRPAPLPAILNVIGHSPAGKAAEQVQRRCISQARKGFIALAIDGIGQGERRIKDYSRYGSLPGAVHRTIGMQAFISGTHLFNFMVWDAIRAIDYLCSRLEVDPERIGCTGTSGGGMMTTYILALEPRIKVAVPVCNPNTWSHRVHEKLSTDHEQVFFGCFASGIDPRGDPLFAHVPKPLLINATTDDNLNPPGGVWALSTWLFKAYAAYGAPHKFQTTMVKAPHDYNKEQREITYAWMLKWLGGDPADFLEENLAVEKEEDLWCTPQGDIYCLKGSLQPHDLVKSFLERNRAEQKKVISLKALEKHRKKISLSIKKVLRVPDGSFVPRAETRESLSITGCRMTPVILKPEKGIVLPGVLIESQKAKSKGPVVLFLHDQGKSSLIKDEKTVFALLDQGVRIFAVDLRGTGETAPGMEGYFWDFLAGKPISGQRVADVRATVRWLLRLEVATELYIWANGINAIWAAMAALLEEDVSGLVLENSLISFENAATCRLPAYNHEIIIPGLLLYFDLPQVYQALAPRRVRVINPLSADKAPVSKIETDRVFTLVEETYRALDSGGKWSVATELGRQDRTEVIVSAFTDN